MSKPNDNAFPNFDSNGEVIHECASGLTKREYFVAAAMTGLAANSWATQMNTESASKGIATKGLPELAVAMADAVIAQMEKQK